MLWRTAQLRAERPGPLDEVRTAMTAFDDVLFQVVPQVYRRAESALAGDDARARARRRCRPSSGSARGSAATATATRTSPAPSRARRWRSSPSTCSAAIERACDRVGRGLTLDSTTTPPSPAVRRILDDAPRPHPDCSPT